jgi:PDZ domain-containing protein
MANGPKKWKWSAGMILLIFVVFLLYFPVPYFVSQPGDAVDLSELVRVEEGYAQEGNLMLTTIKMGKANVLSYAWAKMNDYVDLIEEKQILSQYQDEEEYNRYQQKLMELSKDTAIIAAFRQAGKEVDIINHGVLVMGIGENMPASNVLQLGDVIISIDGNKVNTAEDLIGYLEEKQVGERITLTVRRGQGVEEISLVLEELPVSTEDGKRRAGIGISAVTDRSISTDPEVTIDTRKIGGPSAGLMFAIQIYNLLTPDDITKGYRIAGTGTIDVDGNVGRIGGVHQKVVAAHRAGAEIFFVPYERGAKNSNYELALKTAQEIGSSTEIVPIDTFEEALNYLEQLPEKS